MKNPVLAQVAKINVSVPIYGSTSGNRTRLVNFPMPFCFVALVDHRMKSSIQIPEINNVIAGDYRGSKNGSRVFIETPLFLAGFRIHGIEVAV